MACASAGGTAGRRPAAEGHSQPVGKAEPVAVDAGAQQSARQSRAHDRIAAQAVAQVLAAAASVRGLAAKAPVRSRVISRREMFEHVKARLLADIPPHVAAGTEELLFALGVVATDFDYHASMVKLLGAQLAGFYDPDEDRMYLAADLGEDERLATLAHELVHALQDQHYQLGQRLKYREGASDQQAALHALAEGDATSAMAELTLGGHGNVTLEVVENKLSASMRESLESSAATADLPAILMRAVLSAYVDGLALVHWARRRGGWKAVDEVWRQVPQSTEQVLHPDKLLLHEAPEAVAVPPAPSGGKWKLLYQDVMGELSVRLVLEEWVPKGAAVRGASDWAGDRIAVYRNGEQYAIAWHVRYDTEEAAERGAAGLATGVVAQRAGNDLPPAGAPGGPACRERTERGPLGMVRKGRAVVLVAGPYQRSGATATSRGDCSGALNWGAAILARG